MNFDPIGDFELIVDGLRPIVITPRRGDVADPVSSLRRAITRKEAEESNGQYTTDDSVFHVSTVHYPTKLPLGSHLVDHDNTTWTVLSVAKQTLNARWRYVVRDLALWGDLDLVVWHEIATFAKGKTGAQFETWTRQPTPLRARFQPIEEERRVEHNSVHSPETFVGYFAIDFEVDHNHRFVILNEAGEIQQAFKVIKTRERETLGELFAIECTDTKWPLA